MSGLEKIIAGILAQAEEQAKLIKAEADTKAAAISASAKDESERAVEVVRRESEAECAALLTREEGTQRQVRRLALLAAQVEEIDAAIAQAKAKLLQLPTEEYFDLMFRLFEKYAVDSHGEIKFGTADASRLPNGFVARCQAVFPNSPNSKINVGEPIEGSEHGFVVDYGKIVVNCTVDEIFRVKRQAMRDAVSKIYAER